MITDGLTTERGLTKEAASQGTNFDDLADHFKKRIYGSHKGAIRLAVLQRDLQENIPDLAEKKLHVLDIGAGMGQMGIQLALQGHDVLVNDISLNMLDLAKQEAKKQGVYGQMRWSHLAFQALPTDEKFDVIMCHAVLEWLHEPAVLIAHLQSHLSQNGLVSLMFYNKDALVYHNLIRGNFNKVQNNDFAGMKGGLTPPNPLQASWVEQQLGDHGLTVVYQSGVRVFSDYVGVKRGGNASEEAVLAMELRYSKQQPYQQMGRYIHFICKREECS